jgi:glyoxylase-like metal-dependent hydrolase (beta-lactamase superfamily II)
MTLGGTNTYVVGRDPAYVIDPGPAIAEHLDAVREEGEARGGIAGAVLTHSHADHSAGVAALGAPLLWGAISSTDETSWVPDPTAPALGEVPPGWEAIPTPGHAPDHVVFVHGDVCFCGDLVLGEGSTIVPPAAFGGSLDDYMESLRRVRDLGARILAPGHGPLIDDPTARIDGYLAHREDRERRLVAALDAGERSRTRLLDLVWDDVPELMRPAAAMAMQAHLERLAAEGRAEPSELLE